MNLVAVVPSRGRPAAARETVEAIRETAVRVATKTVLVVDRDDPELAAYRTMVEELPGPAFGGERRPTLVVLDADETGNLVRATNTISLRIAREDPRCVIGNLGDDHRPRTRGWDREVLEALATPGIAYGDDLIHGEKLPSAPFLSASIVLSLGWYALPDCRHLYIDDAWRELGRAAGVLRFLPGVVIEHCHPAVGKGAWDAGYERANSARAVERDRKAYRRWLRGSRFAGDVAKVRSTTGRHAP